MGTVHRKGKLFLQSFSGCILGLDLGPVQSWLNTLNYDCCVPRLTINRPDNSSNYVAEKESILGNVNIIPGSYQDLDISGMYVVYCHT